MVPVRPTYWNIHEWAQVLLYVINFAALGILIARLFLRSQLWLKGDGKLSFDHLGERIGRVMRHVLLQLRTARETYAGLMHLSLFFAFIFLFIGTALATVDYDVFHLFLNTRLLQGNFYLVYE